MGQGRTTGLILDCGAGATHAIPIYDGFGLPHCIKRMEFAGNELDTHLMKLLAKVQASASNECNRTPGAQLFLDLSARVAGSAMQYGINHIKEWVNPPCLGISSWDDLREKSGIMTCPTGMVHRYGTGSGEGYELQAHHTSFFLVEGGWSVARTQSRHVHATKC